MLRLVGNEPKYSSDEVARMLNITPTTLRKYNLHFSKAGIRFRKENGLLAYTKSDVEMLKTFMSLHASGGKTIQQCVMEVLELTEHVINVPEPVTSVPNKELQKELVISNRLEQLEQQLNQHKEQQGQQEQQYIEQIEALKRYIDTKLEEQERRLDERDRQLMEVVRDIQEVKAAQQKKWWHFWKT
ncbi:DUF3967 domain-containing protein [Ectobacillus funiculus]|uniref:DUF3967 domain-containing protein n=1 Tax=Ectobacillus funiculus TaxID=137993 RepID=UPI00101DE00E|nr:DUF3967 domain-containing protein [Ectobacillus funiculus]